MGWMFVDVSYHRSRSQTMLWLTIQQADAAKQRAFLIHHLLSISERLQ